MSLLLNFDLFSFVARTGTASNQAGVAASSALSGGCAVGCGCLVRVLSSCRLRVARLGNFDYEFGATSKLYQFLDGCLMEVVRALAVRRNKCILNSDPGAGNVARLQLGSYTTGIRMQLSAHRCSAPRHSPARSKLVTACSTSEKVNPVRKK